MAEVQKPNTIKKAKRGIWFFMRTTILVVGIVFLCIGVFQYAMHAANLYILTTEGLKLRTECVLKDTSRELLPAYFSDAFLLEDDALADRTYWDYTIRSYDYTMEVEGVSVLPWGNSATVTVVERISNIRGELLQEKRPSYATENDRFPPPEWEGGRYDLKYQRIGDRWYITEIRLIEISPTGTPRPTPNMSLSPMPAVTNTPSVTPTPSATPSMAPSPTPSAVAVPEETPEDDNA